MEIRKIPIDNFKPNPWNPNIMSEEQMQHLKLEYKRVGCIQPPVVREHKGEYQIIDGEHRWRIARDSGFTELEAVVVDMTDEQAKLTTINLNKIKGADDPLKLASLLKDLNQSIKPEDLSLILDMKLDELKAFIDLSNLPDLDSMDLTQKDRFVDCPKCGTQINLNSIKPYHKKQEKKAKTDGKPTTGQSSAAK